MRSTGLGIRLTCWSASFLCCPFSWSSLFSTSDCHCNAFMLLCDPFPVLRPQAHLAFYALARAAALPRLRLHLHSSSALCFPLFKAATRPPSPIILNLTGSGVTRHRQQSPTPPTPHSTALARHASACRSSPTGHTPAPPIKAGRHLNLLPNHSTHSQQPTPCTNTAKPVSIRLALPLHLHSCIPCPPSSAAALVAPACSSLTQPSSSQYLGFPATSCAAPAPAKSIKVAADTWLARVLRTCPSPLFNLPFPV